MEHLSLESAVVEAESFEAFQRYNPLRCHVIDSRSHSRESKVTELRRAQQSFKEVRDPVFEAKRHGRLEVAGDGEGCQGGEGLMWFPRGEDVTQD